MPVKRKRPTAAQKKQKSDQQKFLDTVVNEIEQAVDRRMDMRFRDYEANRKMEQAMADRSRGQCRSAADAEACNNGSAAGDCRGAVPMAAHRLIGPASTVQIDLEETLKHLSAARESVHAAGSLFGLFGPQACDAPAAPGAVPADPGQIGNLLRIMREMAADLEVKTGLLRSKLI